MYMRMNEGVCLALSKRNEKFNIKIYYPHCIIENHIEFDNFLLPALFFFFIFDCLYKIVFRFLRRFHLIRSSTISHCDVVFSHRFFSSLFKSVYSCGFMFGVYSIFHHIDIHNFTHTRGIFPSFPIV